MTPRSGSHSVTELIYHFTFIPKYRRRKLTGEVKKRLIGMIKFCAQVNNWQVVELAIQPDHVHLIVQTNSSDSPSEVMQLIKGGTSRKLRELFPDLEENIWSKSFWADGYYAGTIGTRDLHQVTSYVRKQQQPN
jgi:putative transposase